MKGKALNYFSTMRGFLNKSKVLSEENVINFYNPQELLSSSLSKVWS